jgi:hypothetical protein
MKFTLNHSRAFTGNDISVVVESDGEESIQRVETKLDGFSLGEDALEDSSESYERVFRGAGDAGPGIEHTLVVSVEQRDGKIHRSTCKWTDPI